MNIERASDWRDAGLCNQPSEDAEDWFPVGAGAGAVEIIEYAKGVCGRCPSFHPCRQWGIQQQEPAGIWGGLTEQERRTILRRRGINLPSTWDDTPPRTMRSVWNARAVASSDGHCTWTGGQPVGFEGAFYTPQQLGFILSRGRKPVGVVRRTCTRLRCVLPAHLADQQEREEQTRAGAVSA
ncbi:WhiB family transcriptional regulator [Streptomyces sp. NPDC093223]|uniref:WhiB family transcriptional regulator n=1 Tax=Streptomyces sp. NPDC093223 TaxID=3366033 RepID=UPI0037F97013